MLIPIGVDRDKKRPTVITYWLIGLCLLVSLAELVLLRFNMELHDKLFMSPLGRGDGILMLWPPGWEPLVQGFEFWQLFTYQFLHGGFFHLFFNMLFLFVFGPAVEDRLGRIGFAAFYLIGGVAAGGVHMLAGGEQTPFGYLAMPVVGASGSISAVTGAFLVLFPKAGVRAFVLFLVIGVFTIPAWWIIGFAIARDLIMSGIGTGNVAYEAHLGGYLYGAAISVFLLWRKIIPREPYDLFTMGRQAHRRRQFKELSTKPLSDRMWDAPRVSSSARGPVMSKRSSRESEQQIAQRTKVHEAFAAQDVPLAAQEYLTLVEEHGVQSVSRDAQIAIGNHFHGQGEYQHAALAYKQFTARFASDSEANRVRLMHAVLLARYLNDPIGAQRELDELEAHRLSSAEAELAESLREELS